MPVTITGTNFTGNVSVRFGNATGTSTVVNSPTQVTSVVPTSLATTPASITVTTSGGVATSATTYGVNLAPIITSFSPPSAPEKRIVTLSGFNFLGTAIANRTFSVNGVPVTSVRVSSTEASFPVPIGATTGPITVTTNHGSTQSTSDIVIAPGPAPANDDFQVPHPLSGPLGVVFANNANATKQPAEANHGGNPGGASVWFEWTAPATRWYLFNPHSSSDTEFGVLLSIYTGSDFSSLVPIASASANGSFTRYTSAVPLNAVAGTTYRIAIDGFNGLMGDFRLAWSELDAPAISTFGPTSVFAGQLGNVTITGNDFTPGAIVTVGGVSVPGFRTTVNSTGSITIAQIPLAASTGSAPITVQTPLGTAVSANPLQISPPPAPVISTFSPSSGAVGTQVNITGLALALADSGLQVLFNGVPASPVTIVNSSSISARVPAGATTGPITIATAAGTTSTTSNFTVNSPTTPPPAIVGFSPASGPVGQGIQIAGSNFTAVSAVHFNGVSATFTVDSPNQITAFVPTGASDGLITVTTASGSASSNTPFVVIIPPIITGFSPTVLTDAMKVVITGSGFTGAQVVAFNGTGTGFTIDSDTQITSQLPFGASSGPITVTTPTGTAFSPTHYTVLPPAVPNITSFSPGTIAAGMPVIIEGSGFSGVSEVRFNNVSALFTVLSTTQIEARAPLGNLSPGHITVSTSLGTAVSPSAYAVSLEPIITGIVPSSAPHNRLVTVQGANFSGSNIANIQVRVNGVPIGSSTRSSTAITFAVPAGATSGSITVQTSQGFAVSPMPLIIAAGPPPANDDFADARPISGAIGVATGDTANATKQPGEPHHANHPGGASVWFRWTAPASGLFLFNPNTFTSTQFGIIQSIYTGASVDTLTRVATGLTPTSLFARYGSAAVLDAIAGTTYHIALDGYNGVMADYRLSWNPLAPPTVHGFSPASGTPGQTSPTINITGSNFTPGAPVAFNGTFVSPNDLTYQNPSVITVRRIPLGATTGPITVSTPAGSATSAIPFTIVSAAPEITAFSPSGAKAGTPVQITGARFGGATAVLFNGTAATSFSVTGNGTQIATSVPVGASTGPISVITPSGQAVSPTPFVVIVPPVITSQPESQTVPAFSNVVFSITANSNGPEEYQWRKDGQPIPGNASADTPTLSLTNVTAADAGSYTCFVINNAGGVFSEPAILGVTKVPATITLANLTATYDGTPKAATATTTPAGLGFEMTIAGNVTPVNAGSYGVTATIVDPNYTGSAAGTLVIKPALAAIGLASLTHTYDGTPKAATATTFPTGIALHLTYDGSTSPPTNAGNYAVLAQVTDPNYVGSATDTLTIAPASATIALSGLVQRYNGTPRLVNVATTPANLPVALTYSGSATPPLYPGAYPIEATILDPNYHGTTSGTLLVSTTVFVRHPPMLNGDIEGSVQLLQPGNVTLNGSALVSGDLLVPGSPAVRLNGQPTYGSTLDAHGTATPSDYTITLNGRSVLRHVVRRVDAPALPLVAAPAVPNGTRDVVLVAPGQSPGDFNTVRDLTLNGSVGAVVVPPGTYGDFIANGNNVLVLGIENATTPAPYDLQSLTLNGNSTLRVVGPVVLTVARSVIVNGSAGNPDHPDWLALRIASGGATLNGNTRFAGDIVAPHGTVTLNSSSVAGSVIAGELTLNGSALIADPVP